uniref:RING-type domain-containing protein n=1 Tax=Chromera velia CCMP2878 TaxID=1169474 RepID=A0A0G4HBD2_9ALVE|eukprot:Cvel_6186.t1-p1 / transcript=Cvel_6186.t1 / gene=Cvel_6186 / organism=Chromera_velia_CCMP2878 / gene_product=TNF receptor-associated factor 3, putative / transcript_product=TNF receptor-associated factor 3, putative / location=Cvel_scaffold299:76926-78592(+) / protein_length=406 / sequence_SO=supercontig / SO=protein_coding / is_pseudo=false
MGPTRVSIPATLIDKSCALAEFAEDGVCTICLRLTRSHEARETPCEHVFCRECMETELDRSGKCPNCKKSISKTELKDVNRTLRGTMEKVTVKCKNHGDGCDARVKAKDLDEHLNTVCPMQEADCLFEGCSEKMKRGQLAAHEKKCPKRTVPCDRCKTQIPHNGKRQHNSVCPMAPVSCPNKCGVDPPRSQLQNHLDKDCLEQTVRCFIPGCDWRDKRRRLGSHQTAGVSEHQNLVKKYAGEREVTIQLPDFEAAAGRAEKGTELESGHFIFQGSRFYVRLHPKGDGRAKEGYASIFLIKKDDHRGTVSVAFEVVNGEKENRFEYDYSQQGVEEGRGYINFCRSEVLLSAARKTEANMLELRFLLRAVPTEERCVVLNGYGPAASSSEGGAASRVAAVRPYPILAD